MHCTACNSTLLQYWKYWVYSSNICDRMWISNFFKLYELFWSFLLSWTYSNFFELWINFFELGNYARCYMCVVTFVLVVLLCSYRSFVAVFGDVLLRTSERHGGRDAITAYVYHVPSLNNELMPSMACSIPATLSGARQTALTVRRRDCITVRRVSATNS